MNESETDQPIDVEITAAGNDCLAFQSLLRKALPMLLAPQDYSATARMQLAIEIMTALDNREEDTDPFDDGEDAEEEEDNDSDSLNDYYYWMREVEEIFNANPFDWIGVDWYVMWETGFRPNKQPNTQKLLHQIIWEIQQMATNQTNILEDLHHLGLGKVWNYMTEHCGAIFARATTQEQTDLHTLFQKMGVGFVVMDNLWSSASDLPGSFTLGAIYATPLPHNLAYRLAKKRGDEELIVCANQRFAFLGVNQIDCLAVNVWRSGEICSLLRPIGSCANCHSRLRSGEALSLNPQSVRDVMAESFPLPGRKQTWFYYHFAPEADVPPNLEPSGVIGNGHLDARLLDAWIPFHLIMLDSTVDFHHEGRP